MAEARSKTLEVPFEVERRDLEIPFIGTGGKPDRRTLRIYVPKHVSGPLPLVFVAHYEMPENDPLLAVYLEKGWAVSTVTRYQTAYNGMLFEDNLVFNSAVLAAVRKQPDIDRGRIIVCGGSAGGYMAMMLSILHLGICAAVSFSGIANLPFNLRYMQAANQYNLQILADMTEEERQNPAILLEKLPIPVLGAVSHQFDPILAKLERQPEDPVWAAASPACMAEGFSNPVLFTHFTSDVLVPIDQLTKRHAADLAGETLPPGYRLRLEEFPLAAVFQRSLCENLPREHLAEHELPAPREGGKPLEIPFDITKRFNVVVFDEGRVEAVAGHQKLPDPGPYDATAYLEKQFARSSRETNWLTPAKAVILAERYAGRSLLLPGYGDVDDNIYGSSASHRREVLEELAGHIEGRDADWSGAIREARKARPDLAGVLEEMESRLSF